MEIRLPLRSGTRQWLEGLYVELLDTRSQASSEVSDDAIIAYLLSRIDELGSRVRLLTTQDDTAHELALADGAPHTVDDGGERRSEGGGDHLPNSERQRSIQSYLTASKARRSAAKAYKSGKSKRRTRRKK